MIRAVLLDCGAVLVAPVTGDWMLPSGYAAHLGADFADVHLERFRHVRRDFLHLLPDANLVPQDEAEYAMVQVYYRHVFDAMGIQLADDALEKLAWAQVYDDGRYALFADVLPSLAAWRSRYRLGIVSDAPPSTRRIMDHVGVTAAVDAATYSSELGVLKPGAAIYLETLCKLEIPPEEAVFVDDLPGNLEGAEALGIRGIQMMRPMPALFAAAPAWDGPVVHDFAELDALLRVMDTGG